MTIAVSQSNVIYHGNGSIRVWDIPFPFLSKDDLKVYRIEQGVKSILLRCDYAVDETARTLTYPLAGNEADILSAQEQLMIMRATPLVQDIDLEAQEVLDPSVLETGYDKAMLIAQELSDKINQLATWEETGHISGDALDYLDQAQQVAAQAQAAAAQIQEALPTKQDKLTAGEGIILENNVISAQSGIPLTESGHVTNCITDITPHVDLLLAGGQLSLLAGSKVYIPAGFESDQTTRKFTPVTVDADQTMTAWSTSEQLFIFSDASGAVNRMAVSRCFAGDSTPATTPTNAIWYDTANNVMKRYSSDTSSWETVQLSLPVALVSNEDSAVVSIDQIFNGFGFIGQVVFALPGITCLIPDGRDVDGHLKNKTFTLCSLSVLVFASNNTARRYLTLSTEGVLSAPQSIIYSVADNYNKSSGGNVLQEVNCGALRVASGVVANFDVRPVFHIAERYEMAGASMPSARSIDLTVGASASTYGAPAAGWLVAQGTATAAGQYLELTGNLVGYKSYAYASGDTLKVSLAVRAGDLPRLNYTVGTVSSLKFVYAEGEN